MTEVFIFVAIYVATLTYFEVKIHRLVEKNKGIQFDLGVARVNAEFWHNEARKGGVGR